MLRTGAPFGVSSQSSTAAYTPYAATSVMTSRPTLIHATRNGFRCHSQSVMTVAPASASAVAGTPTSRLPAKPTTAVCVK